MPLIRLDKYLADAGLGTRSKVKDLVKSGQIFVNDIQIKKSDMKIDNEKDVVRCGTKLLSYSEFEYYMLNKPQGVISATKDNLQKTVIELIKEDKRRDLFPVGRLDKDTEGLLIITNDGVFANSMLAPGKHVDKKYFAKIEGRVTEDMIEHFKEGVDIGDDVPTKPAILEIIKQSEQSEINITITEGRYHQIKRMFKAFGMEVIYLKRLSMGKIVLDEALGLGEYRKLTSEELAYYGR